MSLILDALNRAREDDNPVPGLATHHRMEQVAVNRRQYLLWVALSVAVVVIAWLVMERYSALHIPGQDIVTGVAKPSMRGADSDSPGTDAIGERAVTAEPVAPAVVENTPPAAASSSPALASQVPEVATVRPEVPAEMATDAPAVDSPLEFTEAAAQMATVEEGPVPPDAPEENDAVARLYRNPGLAEEPVIDRPARQPDTRSAARQIDTATKSAGADRAEQNIDIDEILRQAREEAKNASLPDHPVPFLIDLSQQTKDSIPSVYYLRHDYSSDSSRSTVVLNSKTLSVGDKIGRAHV